MHYDYLAQFLTGCIPRPLSIPPCCVLRNGTDCVPGDQHGPTFLTELGKEIKTLFFHHQGKCIPGRGSCPE